MSWEREVTDLPPKGSQTQSALKGKKNYDNGDYDDDDGNDNDEYNVFSSYQMTSNRVGTRGGQ